MTTQTLGAALTTLALSLLSSASWADHGHDFLLVQTARMRAVGSVVGIARQDYTRDQGVGALSFEPLLSWTARDGLAVEVNGDAEKVQGEPFHYEASTVGLRLRLTPAGQALTWGLAARYGIAAHADGSDVVKLAGLVCHEAGPWLLGANLNYAKPQGARRQWAYSLGLKRELRHHLGLGLEVAGNLGAERGGEVVLGLFSELTHDFQINAGVGTGFDNDVTLTVKTALVWRFR
jgi:hypothetical protein